MSSAWPPDEDRPDGDGRVEPLPLPVVIPDDARDLERDRVAWLREQRAARRRAQWGRLTGDVGSDPTAVRILGGIVVLAGLASTLLLLLANWTGERATQVPAARPLAAAAAPPGSVGGHLPSGRVRLGGAPVPLQALRPAVLVLVPPACRCDRAVTDVVAQAGEYHLPVYLTTSRDLTQVTRLAAGAGHGRARGVLDPEAVLERTVAPHGLTAVLVHADGVVGAVVNDSRPGARLEPRLRPLLGAGPRRPSMRSATRGVSAPTAGPQGGPHARPGVAGEASLG